MISIDRALEIIFANLPARETIEVPFEKALGCVAAEDLVANRSIPPFHRSAMDGYALRAEDVREAPVRLPLVGEVRAGGGIPNPLDQGQTVAIMTGAPIPQGADSVQIQEKAERSADGKSIVFCEPVDPGENVRPMGSQASVGDVVVERGRVIGPPEIAVIATFGYARVTVWKKPKVALFSTGDELVDITEMPRSDQIRNTNSYSLAAQLRMIGVEWEDLGIVRDNREELRRSILEGLERDVLIVTGGVSVGAHDHVKAVLEELGLELLFTRVAMKPGKPTVFARRGATLFFGLPGNPVSTIVAFENFVRPGLGRLAGLANPELPRVEGTLLEDMRQAPGRTAFLPARTLHGEEGWEIKPLPYSGSDDIIAFARANSTVIFPGDRDRMARGETVEAMLLPDFAHR